jgi:hypothetical protein
LILTGDQKLADGILKDAFLRARSAIRHADDIDKMDVFKLGFDAFEDALHRKGVVIVLNRSGQGDGSIGDRVSRLTYIERVAVSLLVVEKLSPRASATLSGRPASVLENALADALPKLDEGVLNDEARP